MSLQSRIDAYRAEIRKQHQGVMEAAMAPLLPYEAQLRQVAADFAGLADFEAVFGRELAVRQDYSGGIASIRVENTGSEVYNDLAVTCLARPDGIRVHLEIADRSKDDPNSRNFSPSAIAPEPDCFSKVVATPAEMTDFLEGELGRFIADSLEFEAGHDGDVVFSAQPAP